MTCCHNVAAADSPRCGSLYNTPPAAEAEGALVVPVPMAAREVLLSLLPKFLALWQNSSMSSSKLCRTMALASWSNSLNRLEDRDALLSEEPLKEVDDATAGLVVAASAVGCDPSVYSIPGCSYQRCLRSVDLEELSSLPAERPPLVPALRVLPSSDLEAAAAPHESPLDEDHSCDGGLGHPSCLEATDASA